MSLVDTRPRLGSSELIRLIASQVCVHASMAGMRMSSPLWALQLHYSAWAVGLLLALFALASVFLALPAGRYADRHGFKKPVFISVVLTCLGALIPAVLPVFATLCVGALLTGAGTGLMLISLQRHVGRYAEDSSELKRVFSWISIGPALSNFLGPLAAGLMIDHASRPWGGQPSDALGFRFAFLLMALTPLLSWWLIRGVQELPMSPRSDGVARGSVWDLLGRPGMRRLMTVNWVMSSCWDVHLFVVPVIGHAQGYNASVIGTILGSFAFAATSVRVLMPVLAARAREGTVVSAALVVAATMFAVYPFMPSALAMGICSVLLGLALGSVQPMIMSSLHQITPEDRHGEALALRMMAINASSVLMPMVFGAAGAVVGVSVVFWTVGAAAGLGSRLAWRLGQPPPQVGR